MKCSLTLSGRRCHLPSGVARKQRSPSGALTGPRRAQCPHPVYGHLRAISFFFPFFQFEFYFLRPLTYTEKPSTLRMALTGGPANSWREGSVSCRLEVGLCPGAASCAQVVMRLSDSFLLSILLSSPLHWGESFVHGWALKVQEAK